MNRLKRLYNLIFKKKFLVHDVVVGAYRDIDDNEYTYYLAITENPKQLKTGDYDYDSTGKVATNKLLMLEIPNTDVIDVLINQLVNLKYAIKLDIKDKENEIK